MDAIKISGNRRGCLLLSPTVLRDLEAHRPSRSDLIQRDVSACANPFRAIAKIASSSGIPRGTATAARITPAPIPIRHDLVNGIMMCLGVQGEQSRSVILYILQALGGVGSADEIEAIADVVDVYSTDAEVCGVAFHAVASIGGPRAVRWLREKKAAGLATAILLEAEGALRSLSVGEAVPYSLDRPEPCPARGGRGLIVDAARKNLGAIFEVVAKHSRIDYDFQKSERDYNASLRDGQPDDAPGPDVVS